MMKNKLPKIAIGAALVAASVFGTATAAGAATYRGPYYTFAQCRQALVIAETHGYNVTRGCYERWGWWFITA